jgi:hypothetical protein
LRKDASALPAAVDPEAIRRRNIRIALAGGIGLAFVLVVALAVPGVFGSHGSVVPLTIVDAPGTAQDGPTYAAGETSVIETAAPPSTPGPSTRIMTVIGKATAPTASPGNGMFEVDSIPGSTCRLWRRAVGGDNTVRRSTEFTLNGDGVFQAYWGGSWPINDVTVAVYTTCTSPAGVASQSADVFVFWPINFNTSPAAG